jgi:site-specific recombinase XerD
MLTTFRRRPEPEPLFDRRGYYRSPITLSSYRKGKPAPNKGKKFPVEVLTRAEVEALIGVCGRGLAGWRNRAIIAVMAYAGLRVSEALALMPKDIDLEHGLITVLHGKGDKRRVVALGPSACAIVERWLTVRRSLDIPRTKPLFCVISQPTMGLPVSAIYVRNLLRQLAVKASIEKRVHPHGLRHFYASELANQPKVPLTAIQTMLGHTSLAITEAYLHKLNPAAELELIRSLDWSS